MLGNIYIRMHTSHLDFHASEWLVFFNLLLLQMFSLSGIATQESTQMSFIRHMIILP
eukprot:c14323_g1_i1 orf=229-399(+)